MVARAGAGSHPEPMFTSEGKDTMTFTVRWWLTAGQDTRRWAWYHLNAQMCAMDTRTIHGPEVRDA